MKSNFAQIETSQLSDQLPNKIDLFICCASFEKRTTVVPQILSDLDVSSSLVFFVDRFFGFSKENLDAIGSYRSLNSRIIPLNYLNQTESAQSLVREISLTLTKDVFTVVIDITTFTHEHLLILLRVLSRYSHNSARIFFSYVGAGEYSLGDSVKKKWLSRGVIGIRSILGYPGQFETGRPTQIIGLMGFESSRMAAIIDQFQPNAVRIGRSHEEGSIEAEHYSANLHWHKVLCSSLTDIEEFEFDAKNPKSIFGKLECLSPSDNSVNTIIAPLSTKLSTIGAGLFAIKYPNTRICYALAAEYNFMNYASVGSKTYLFSAFGGEVSSGVF